MKTTRSGGKTKQAVKAGADEGTRIDKVRTLLKEATEQLKGAKFTVGDFVRLLQLEKEIEAEEPPREIRVTWIDRAETPDSGE